MSSRLDRCFVCEASLIPGEGNGLVCGRISCQANLVEFLTLFSENMGSDTKESSSERIRILLLREDEVDTRSRELRDARNAMVAFLIELERGSAFLRPVIENKLLKLDRIAKIREEIDAIQISVT